MNKLLWLITILSLMFFSCQDEIQYDEKLEATFSSTFKIEDAKNYFETTIGKVENLNFQKIKARSCIEKVNACSLIPLWNEAKTSKNNFLSVVEVPLEVRGSCVIFRTYINSQGKTVSDNTIVKKRLVLMKRPDNSLYVFVMTLILDQDYICKKGGDISDFNYIGNHDFSGYILFSNMNGDFVEGYCYVNGKQDHVLSLKPETELADVVSKNIPYKILLIGEQYDDDNFERCNLIVTNKSDNAKDSKSQYSEHACFNCGMITCKGECTDSKALKLFNEDTVSNNEIKPVTLVITERKTGKEALIRVGSTSECYYMPLYYVELYYREGPNELKTIVYEAIRFGVKSINNVTKVVGLSASRCDYIKTFLPDKYALGNAGHAWQMFDNYLIHIGTTALDRGVGALGCIMICHGEMSDLYEKLLVCSGAKDGFELVASKRFIYDINDAPYPYLGQMIIK